jgi:hypothetical protein
MAPTVVAATHAITRKLGPRNEARMRVGKMPSQRRRLRRGCGGKLHVFLQITLLTLQITPFLFCEIVWRHGGRMAAAA